MKKDLKPLILSIEQELLRGEKVLMAGTLVRRRHSVFFAYAAFSFFLPLILFARDQIPQLMQPIYLLSIFGVSATFFLVFSILGWLDLVVQSGSESVLYIVTNIRIFSSRRGVLQEVAKRSEVTHYRIGQNTVELQINDGVPLTIDIMNDLPVIEA